MSQNNRRDWAGWAAFITAIATLLGTFGISQFFPQLMIKILKIGKNPTYTQSIQLSSNTIKELENYISSQKKNLTEKNKTMVLEEAVKDYRNPQLVKLSVKAIEELENYISSQGKNITEENKAIVLEEALEDYINSQEQNYSKQPIVTKPKISSLDWKDTANSQKISKNLDQDFSFICLPNGTIHTIWGTDIYTSDSSICTAAVHSGLINAKDGGEITIRIAPGDDSYQGTKRNGVESRRYGSWGASFIFVE